MRANPRTRIRPATHTRAHIHIYTHVCTCTHVYAHAKEIFWHQICSTASPNRGQSSVRHHSLLLSNRCTIHINIGTTLAASSVQTISICHSSTNYLPPISNHLLSSNHLPTVSRPSVAHNSPSSRARHIPSLSDFHYNQLIILSICQYVIKPYQFSIYLPHSHLRHSS